MSDPSASAPPIDLQARIGEIEELVFGAHAACEAGDAAVCGWRARTAVEAMLQLLADQHALSVRTKGQAPVTIEALRVALRHGGVMDRRLEDHVAHVQNIGNRAAHAQQHPDLAVDVDEARTVLPALDQAWLAVRQRVEPEDVPLPAVPAAGPSALAIALRFGLAVLLGTMVVVLTFLAVVVLAAMLDTPGDQAGTPDAHPPLTPPQVDALLRDSALPERQDPFEEAVSQVRAAQALTEAGLELLPCEELMWVRNWIWARHGHPFQSAEARTWFAERPGYLPYRSAGRTEANFDEVDEANLDLLNRIMGERGCDCPRPLRKRAPCPG